MMRILSRIKHEFAVHDLLHERVFGAHAKVRQLFKFTISIKLLLLKPKFKNRAIHDNI